MNYKFEDIHHSLDQARDRVILNANNVELQEKIKNELGDDFWPEFNNSQKGLLWRNVLTPDNSFVFYMSCCRYIGIEPVCFEFLGDTYVSINEEKKGLGQLKILLDDSCRAKVNIMDLHYWNKRLLSEIKLKTGENLVDFHHDLLKRSGYKVVLRDNTEWAHKHKKPVEWYYKYLLHFVVNGVLFDTFFFENDKKFLNEVVFPAIEKIEIKYGMKPLIVSLFPDPNNQTDEEDFYWWSYPPILNKYIIELVRERGLTVIKI